MDFMHIILIVLYLHAFESLPLVISTKMAGTGGTWRGSPDPVRGLESLQSFSMAGPHRNIKRISL